MKQLSKVQQQQRDEHCVALQTAYQEMQDALEEFASLIEGPWQDVTRAVNEYNAKVREADDWRKGLLEAMRTYYEERSGKWQEGDAGQAYQEWMDAYDSVELEDLELERLEVPEPSVQDDQSGLLDELPDGPQ